MKYAISIFIFLALTTFCFAHVTPPVKLASEEEVVQKLMPGLKYEVKDVRLTPAQRSEIQSKTGWKPSENSVRIYEGRDDQGNLKHTVVFLTDYTMHGSIRVAACCDPDGKPRGSEIVETSEESYNWVKPLVGSSGVNSDSQKSNGKMTQYYSGIVNRLVKNAPAVIDVLKVR
jgi:hypothetical protein